MNESSLYLHGSLWFGELSVTIPIDSLLKTLVVTSFDDVYGQTDHVDELPKGYDEVAERQLQVSVDTLEKAGLPKAATNVLGAWSQVM